MTPRERTQTTTMQGTRAEIDAGLRDYFRYVYNQMVIGLSITGLVAWGVAQSDQLMNAIFNTPLAWVVMLAPLGFLMFGMSPRRISMMSLGKAQAMFWFFSGIMGLSLSYIFLAYSGESITRVFFITAAMFAGMSLFGYTTKKDLTGMGGFLIMGMIGVLIAMVVNMFMQSAMLHFVTSVISVLVFTGLVAFETQNLKSIYFSAASREMTYKAGIMGAVNLYMSFVIIFQNLLHLFGGQE